MTDIYQQKVDEYKIAIARLTPDLNALSYTRLAVFLCTIVLILVFAAKGHIVPVVMFAILGTAGFVLTLRQYNRIAARKQSYTFLKQINESELLRQSNGLANFPTGIAFAERAHGYAADLDIFGQHSLFQLLNRTTTESGAKGLAQWMTEPAGPETISERQEAVKELSAKLEWRQEFQAAGMQFESNTSDYQKLLAWINEPEELLPSRTKYLFISLLLSSLTGLAFGFALYKLIFYTEETSWLHWLPFGAMLFINSLFLKSVRERAEHIILNTQQNIPILGGYQSLITLISEGRFHASKLETLHSRLTNNGSPAASEIGSLKKTLEIFQQRGNRRTIGNNQFYGIINNILLLDIHLILRSEQWKQRNRARIGGWISAVTEWEVLSSLAGFAHANPRFCFPQITTDPYLIDFKAAGHPLLKSRGRVCNDFHLRGRGAITMITGSNMAGKSTFLRTIGVNLVLGLMGAPCCATEAKLSQLRIFTSMRTQDNLEESVSSFYAELQRIEQLLKLVDSGEPIFFLLDEMFKGTNSQDRFRGGVSLIRQLSELNAFGMISTHDLDLANLTLDLMIDNFSFNSKIRDGTISFDYHLTEGICTDFNASELMKQSGIKILSDISTKN